MAKAKKEKQKDINTLDKQLEKLQKLVDNMVEYASDVVKEYDADLSDSEISGSLNDLSSVVTEISEDSPFLDDLFKGDSWKRVLKATIPHINLDENPPPTKKETDEEINSEEDGTDYHTGPDGHYKK